MTLTTETKQNITDTCIGIRYENWNTIHQISIALDPVREMRGHIVCFPQFVICYFLNETDEVLNVAYPVIFDSYTCRSRPLLPPMFHHGMFLKIRTIIFIADLAS